MTTRFLIYGANGYVGEAAAQLALAQGLQPILAGRNRASLEPLATALGVEFRACALDDAAALDRTMSRRSGRPALRRAVQVHFEADGRCVPARRGALPRPDRRDPGVRGAGGARCRGQGAPRHAAAGGRLRRSCPPTAWRCTRCAGCPRRHRLELGFQSVGPAGLPPGTQRTMIELLALSATGSGRGGELVVPERGREAASHRLRPGPVEAARFTWGDVFTWRTTAPASPTSRSVTSRCRPPCAAADGAGPGAAPCSVSRRCEPRCNAACSRGRAPRRGRRP